MMSIADKDISSFITVSDKELSGQKTCKGYGKLYGSNKALLWIIVGLILYAGKKNQTSEILLYLPHKITFKDSFAMILFSSS